MRKTIIAALLSFAAGLGCESDEDAYVHMQMCEDKCEDAHDTCICGRREYCDPYLSSDACESSDLVRCSPDKVVESVYTMQCDVELNTCQEKC